MCIFFSALMILNFNIVFFFKTVIIFICFKTFFKLLNIINEINNSTSPNAWSQNIKDAQKIEREEGVGGEVKKVSDYKTVRQRLERFNVQRKSQQRMLLSR